MKKKYDIDVDCANCAGLMENAVNKLEGVNNVSINFIMQKMMIDIDDRYDADNVIRNVIKTCKKVELNCEIYV